MSRGLENLLNRRSRSPMVCT